MRRRCKNALIIPCITVVFLVWLKRGLTPSSNAAGFIPSGAMNEPFVVLFSALVLSGLTWVLLEFLFWIFLN